MKIGTTLLRVAVGGVFIGHGSQKLFGLQGGHGLGETAQAFEDMGLRPGIVHATAAGIAETGGGAGLLLGYQTPLAAAGIIAVMTTAIRKVHLSNGWLIQDGGYEYNAVLIAAAAALADYGPGKLSLDALRGREKSGLKWGLLALGLGVAGSFAATTAADRLGGPAEAESPTAPEPTVAPAKPAVAPEPAVASAEPAVAPGVEPDAVAPADHDVAAPADPDAAAPAEPDAAAPGDRDAAAPGAESE